MASKVFRHLLPAPRNEAEMLGEGDGEENWESEMTAVIASPSPLI